MRVPGTFAGPRARIWAGPIPGTHEPGFAEPELVEIPVPHELRQTVHGPHDLELHRFRFGDCTILLGREPTPIGEELRWRLSISAKDRHPTWDEIKTARYRLLGPDTVVAMLLPPVKHYVNYAKQDHVFQLCEIVDECRPWQ